MIHSTTLWVLLSIVLPLASLSFLVAAINAYRSDDRLLYSLLGLVLAVATCFTISLAVSS